MEKDLKGPPRGFNAIKRNKDHYLVIGNRSRLLRFGIWTALLLPFIVVVLLYLCFGVNSLYWDEWSFFNYYRRLCENGFDLQYFKDLIFLQHNEHKMCATVVAHMLIWFLSGCNNVVTTLVVQSCLLVAFLIIVNYTQKRGLHLIFLLPISAIIFSLKQGQLLFWSAFLTMPLFIMFSTISFYCYYRHIEQKRTRELALSVLFSALSTFSSAQGLITWIAYIAFFFLRKIFEKEKLFQKSQVIVFLSGVFCWCFYFYRWTWSNPNYAAKNFSHLLKTIVMSIGSPLFWSESTSTDLSWLAYLLGAVVLGIFTINFFQICYLKKITKCAFPLLMTFFYLGAVALISFGRGGLSNILGTQYSCMPIWFWVSLYILSLQLWNEREQINSAKLPSKTLVFVYIFFFLLSNGYYDTVAKPFIDVLHASAYSLQHYDEIPLDMKERYLYPYPSNIEESADWIRKHQVFLFGQNKIYEYPFGDYIIAEKCDDIILPKEQMDPGFFCVDTINGSPVTDEPIRIDAEIGLDFSLWALDNFHYTVPESVFVEIGGYYYKLKQLPRSDVAEVYQNTEYLNSGFLGYVSTSTLASGVYPVNLIVVCEDAQSYYSSTVTLVEIGEEK